MEKVFVLLAAVLVIYLGMRYIEYRFFSGENDGDKVALRTVVRDALMVAGSVIMGGSVFLHFDKQLVGFFNSVFNAETAQEFVVDTTQIMTDDCGF